MATGPSSPAAARIERLAADRLDLTEVLPRRLAGHLHLVTQAREALEDVFVGMAMRSRRVLRSRQGGATSRRSTSLRIILLGALSILLRRLRGAVSVLLRRHTSAGSDPAPPAAGVLPIYAVAPGRTYRKEHRTRLIFPCSTDRGACRRPGVTFARLEGTIDTFVRAVFGEGTGPGCGLHTSRSLVAAPPSSRCRV